MEFTKKQNRERFYIWVSVFYPSIEGSNMAFGSYLTINQLYSKYIFAQDVKYIQKQKMVQHIKSHKLGKL